MQDPLLRKEPTMARDDIPVLNDRINVSWDRLSQVLTRVPNVQQTAAAAGFNRQVNTAAPGAPLTSLSQQELQALSQRIIEGVAEQLDDAIDMALSNSYQRMRNDLTNQMRALVAECVREEIRNILQSSNRSPII